MSGFHLQCIECGTAYDEHEVRLVCPTCTEEQEPGGVTRGVLNVVLEGLPSAWPSGPAWSDEFLSAFLPLPHHHHLPRLVVGGTPLLEVPQLRGHLGLPHLWIKDDTRNPSGSTKDRASLLVVSKAIEYGFSTVATASTGNAATALAAVAASAGVQAVVFVPATAPEAKLVQMMTYGATLLPIDSSYDEAFELCTTACQTFGWYNRNTALNPFTIEGKKTVALEIALDLAPNEPDVVLVPTGDGVILSGMAKGFADLQQAGLVKQQPRLIAVQPDGAAAIATALRSGADHVIPVPTASSVADSLTVQIPKNAIQCLRRVRESLGAGVIVSDPAIIESIGELARHTGVFAEPSSAAALAGLHVALSEGLVDSDERIVLLITANGLKDVAAAAKGIEQLQPIPSSIDAVAERLRIS